MGSKLLPRQRIKTVKYLLLIGELTTFPNSLSSASVAEERDPWNEVSTSSYW